MFLDWLLWNFSLLSRWNDTNLFLVGEMRQFSVDKHPMAYFKLEWTESQSTSQKRKNAWQLSLWCKLFRFTYRENHSQFKLIIDSSIDWTGSRKTSHGCQGGAWLSSHFSSKFVTILAKSITIPKAFQGLPDLHNKLEFIARKVGMGVRD